MGPRCAIIACLARFIIRTLEGAEQAHYRTIPASPTAVSKVVYAFDVFDWKASTCAEWR